MAQLVELPRDVKWCGTLRAYDLDDRAERLVVYELVLQKGTAEQVRRYIDVDQLLELWDDMFLPSSRFCRRVLLARRVGIDEMIRWAPEKDRGFDESCSRKGWARRTIPRAASSTSMTTLVDIEEFCAGLRAEVVRRALGGAPDPPG